MKLSGLGSEHVRIEQKEDLETGFLPRSQYTLKHKLFNGGWSQSLSRECIVRPLSVGVLLLDPLKDSVVLIEQFRVGPMVNQEDPWLLEVVAGLNDKNESLESLAIREAKEEANCDIQQLIPITEFFVSPGATNEKLKLFCAFVDSGNVGGVYGVPEEGEDIKVHVIPCEEAYNMVKDGRIANAPAIIALQWLKLHRHEIQRHYEQQE